MFYHQKNKNYILRHKNIYNKICIFFIFFLKRALERTNSAAKDAGTESTSQYGPIITYISEAFCILSVNIRLNDIIQVFRQI